MSVGSDLKKAREQKKITLEAVSQRTRIPLKYLEAIEKDQFDVFASQAYAKGFIRAYAKAAGADPAALTQQFKAQVEPAAVKIEPPHPESEIPPGVAWPGLGKKNAPRRERLTDEAFDPDLMQAQEESSRRPSALPKPLAMRNLGTRLVGWGLSLILAGVLFFFLAPVAIQILKHWKAAAVKPAPAAAAPMEEAAPAAGDSVIADKYQHLILKGLDDSWIRVTLDDGKASSQIDLAPGEVKSFRALRNFKLRVGNAGGVDIVFNGKSLGVLGSTGEVVDLDLPPVAASDSSDGN